MKLWTTEIKAIDPRDGRIKIWMGPYVPGINLADAESFCQTNELGYCKVMGELAAEIPCKEGTDEPDWDNEIDYEKINSN